MKINILWVLLVCILPSQAWAASTGKDIEGAKDHALVERYPGSSIIRYAHSEYEDYHFVLGPLISNKRLATERYAGKFTTIIYQLPDEVTTLQALRNFEKGFKKNGIRSRFTCLPSSCGHFLPREYVLAQGEINAARYLGVDVYNINSTSDYRYWNGIAETINNKAFITLMVYKSPEGATAAVLDILEPAQVNTSLAKVDLNSLDESLSAQGKAVLPGIYFDEGKATLKPVSNPAIATVAEYLKANPTLYAYVVAHTHNEGEYITNVTLSKKRAAAVVSALTTQNNVPIKQLHAVGVGPVSPIASNGSKQGKSINQRVELVIR